MRHVEGVRAQRAARFFELSAAVEPGVRERAEELLETLHIQPMSSLAWPPVDHLSAATRVLRMPFRDEAAERPDSVEAVADSLDLQVVPGAFDAAREGRGEPLTVRVYPLPSLRVRPRGSTTVRLYWIAPDGSEETARTVQVEPAAFYSPGFELYVRAPLSEPGLWHLVVEVEHDERRARGLPVPVECVRDFRARVQGVREGIAARGIQNVPWGPVVGSLRGIIDHGIRLQGGLGVEQVLALVEAVLAGESPDLGSIPLPHALGRADLTFWAVAPAGEIERVVLVPAPTSSAPESLFVGPVGQSWIELAERTGSLVVAAPLDPFRTEVGEDEQGREVEGATATSAEIIARARAAHPGKPLVLVARGDVIATLRLERAIADAGPPDVDLVVLSSERAGAVALDPSLETLIVSPGGPADAPSDEEADAGPVQRVRGAGTSFLTEPRLAEIVERWLVR